MSFWEALTAMGDANMTLPAALVVAVLLVKSDTTRLAWQWGGLFVATLVVVVVTKLAFLGWGAGIAAINFTGISGHSSRAMTVWPVLVFVLAWTAHGVIRRTAIALGFVLAALICMSRVMLTAHSVSEALVGFAIGFASSWFFIRHAAKFEPKPLDRRLFPVVGFVLVGCTLLDPAPTKEWMREAAVFLSERNDPFRRTDLLSR